MKRIKKVRWKNTVYSSTMKTSARKIESEGILLSILKVVVTAMLYRLGISPTKLQKNYK